VFVAEFLGNLDVELYNQIASPSVLHIGHPLAVKDDGVIALRTWFNLYFVGTIKRGYLNLRTKDRLRISNRDDAQEMFSLSLKEGVFLDVKCAKAITRRAALVGAGMSLAGESHPHPVIHTGGD